MFKMLLLSVVLIILLWAPLIICAISISNESYNSIEILEFHQQKPKPDLQHDLAFNLITEFCNTHILSLKDYAASTTASFLESYLPFSSELSNSMPVVIENYITEAQSVEIKVHNGFPKNVPHQNQTSSFYQTRLSSSSCNAVLIDFQGDPSIITPLNYVKYLVHILNIMKSDSFLDENPDYVIFNLNTFVREEIGNFNPINRIFYGYLQFIHVTSKFFVIPANNEVSNSQQILQMICLHCTPKDYDGPQTIPKSYSCSLDQITEKWNQVHRNLSNNTLVRTQRAYLIHLMGQSYKQVKCNSRNKFNGDVRLCTAQLLAKIFGFHIILDEAPQNSTKRGKHFTRDFLNDANTCANFLSSELNISEESKNFSKRASNCIHHQQTYSIEMDNWQVIDTYRSQIYKNNSQRLEYVPQSWNKDPLSFLIVLNKRSLNKGALYKPYDHLTWIMIFVSMITVGFVLTLSVSLHRKFFPKNYKNFKPQDGFLAWHQLKTLIMMSSATITEQNPSDKLARRNVLSFRILFGIWLLISIIISNAYTGIITSFLCSTIPPGNLPQTLDELVKERYPIFSLDKVPSLSLVKDIHYSYILISEYLWTVVDTRNVIKKSKLYYRELQSRTIYIRDKNKFLFAYDKGLYIPPELVFPRTSKSSNGSLKIPSNFAYISTGKFLETFVGFLEHNKNIIVYQPPANFQPIYILTAFTVSRNYLALLFKQKLHSIVEAGLPGLWLEKEIKCYHKWYYNNYKCLKDTFATMVAEGRGEDIWNTTFCQSGQGPEAEGRLNGVRGKSSSKIGEDEDSKPLPMGVMLSVFILWVGGIALATVGLLYETILMCCTAGVNWIKLNKSIKENNRRRRRDSFTFVLQTFQDGRSERRMNRNEMDEGEGNANFKKAKATLYVIPGSVQETNDLNDFL